ncbi:MAG: hypothetical protein R3F11_26630 [Verrucomicrobiales bacterium]
MTDTEASELFLGPIDQPPDASGGEIQVAPAEVVAPRAEVVPPSPDPADAAPDPIPEGESDPAEPMPDPDSPAAAEAQPAPAPADLSEDGGLAPGQRAAKAALLGFLRGTTAEERLQYVSDPEAVAPRLRDFYGEGSLAPDEPLSIELQVSGPVADTKKVAHIFDVTFPGENRFPIAVENSGDHYTLDWDAFIQCRESLLDQFMKSGQDSEIGFYVVLRRTHYFGTDLPGASKMICLNVTPPQINHTGYQVFLEPQSAVAAQLGRLQWNSRYFHVVQLGWKKMQSGSSVPVVVKVIRDRWRD